MRPAPMGAIGTRLSLRPLFAERRNEMQRSDDHVGRMPGVCLGVATYPASSLRKQAPITADADYCAMQGRRVRKPRSMGTCFRKDDNWEGAQASKPSSSSS